MKHTSFRNFAWGLLGYNVFIVLWGAFVRASKSGDGCGSHWPTCNGEPMHIPDNFASWVEYIHRVTSGLDLPLVILLVVWAFRLYPKKHAVRWAAVATLVFIMIEAAFGAVLVIYGLVVDNDSTARAIVLSAHLLNTFLLLGALTLTAWWGGGHEVPKLKGQGALGWWFAFTILSTLLVGVSGSIAALGDTLFPATEVSHNIAEVLRHDLAPTQHILIRLRVLHPFLAVGVGVLLVFLARAAAKTRPAPEVKRLAVVTCAIFVFQLAFGLLNRAMLAPVYMQIIHLFLADVVWVTLVLMTSATLGAKSVVHSRRETETARENEVVRSAAEVVL